MPQQLPKVGRVIVLLPTLNEERAIERVLDRIPHAELERRGYEVFVWVVDGNSTDATREVAMRKGVAVMVQQGNGKGSGMQQAFSYFMDAQVRHAQHESPAPSYYIMLDSDGTYPPESIPDFVTALESGYEVVLGSRFLGNIEKDAISDLNHLGNLLLTALARFLYRVPVSDVCTGMWGFRGSFLRRLGLSARHLRLSARGFDLEANMFASACLMNVRFGEIPIGYSRRIGEPKLVPIRTGLLIAWRLLLKWLQLVEHRTTDEARRRTEVVVDAV